MQVPHPVKIFNAIRILVSLALIALGTTGVLHVLYAKIIPEKTISLLPPVIYSVSRENIILIASFVLLLAGLLIILKKVE